MFIGNAVGVDGFGDTRHGYEYVKLTGAGTPSPIELPHATLETDPESIPRPTRMIYSPVSLK
jgi:hypothetical protein